MDDVIDCLDAGFADVFSMGICIVDCTSPRKDDDDGPYDLGRIVGNASFDEPSWSSYCLTLSKYSWTSRNPCSEPRNPLCDCHVSDVKNAQIPYLLI